MNVFIKSVVGVVIGVFSLTASAQKAEKVTASWLPIMQTMAYYVALEEGLFTKAGIEIE